MVNTDGYNAHKHSKLEGFKMVLRPKKKKKIRELLFSVALLSLSEVRFHLMPQYRHDAGSVTLPLGHMKRGKPGKVNDL